MASDTTTAAFIFKRKYADRKPGDNAQRFHPLLQLIKKKPDFVGHDSSGTFYYVMRSANPQAISGQFADAQDAVDGTDSGADGASSGLQFGAQDVTKYGMIRLNGRALRKARQSDGAFVNLVSMESDGVIEEMGDTLAFELYRDANANRGTRSSISSNTVTLTTADDA